MASREAVDLYLGQPGLEQPTPRPVTDDDPCGRCSHPRWMHNGLEMRGHCAVKHWVDGEPASQRDVPSCRCVNFIEPNDA